MNIFYFHQYFTTPSGSFGTRSYELSKYLVSKGYNVTIICLSNDRSDTGLNKEFKNSVREGIVDGIKVIEYQFFYSNKQNIFERSKVFLKYVLRSLLLILKEDIDLIYASSTPLTIAIPGILGKVFKGIPFIFEVRDLWPELPRAMGVLKNPLILFILDLLQILSYASADICIGLSKGICEGIEKKNFLKRKVYLVPNACDLKLFKNSSQTLKDNRFLYKYGLSFNKNDFVVAFAGAHGKANGLDFLLEVGKALLKRNRQDIKILFIGDGSYKQKLLMKRNMEKIENCFFIDPISKLELSEVFNKSIKAGLMILDNIPEFYDGTSPNKFFDYLAASLPVLCNYPGWISTLIKENDIGFSVKPYDYDDFARKLVFLSDNPDLLILMGSKSRDLGERKFSREKINNIIFKIIKNKLNFSSEK